MEPDEADPYVILGIPRAATAAQVTAAYRRAAKRLHPDVPVTGDRAAFLRLQEAYQVLNDPIRRAVFEQSERAVARPAWRQEERELAFVAPVSWRFPPYLGIAMAVATLLALGKAGMVLFGGSAMPADPPSRAAVAPAAAATAPTPQGAADAPAGIRADADFGDHFIAPGAAPAVLSARMADRAGLIRIGQLPSFTVVALIRPADADGQAEIRAAGGRNGFVDATRLQPGDARAARSAACLYNAGAPPRGGTMLVRHPGGTGPGAARVAVENREDRPAVFKLRDARNAVASAVYLGPRGQAVIEDLPAGAYRAEFAMGDLWSGACGVFMAGMRAQRFAKAQDLTGPVRFSISATTPADDISDDEFSRD